MIRVLGELPIGVRAEPDTIRNLMSALNQLVAGPADGTTVALLLTGPGVGPISDADRQWSTLLAEMAADFGVPLEPIFRANDEAVVLVEPA
jgi:hypothetical protein